MDQGTTLLVSRARDPQQGSTQPSIGDRLRRTKYTNTASSWCSSILPFFSSCIPLSRSNTPSVLSVRVLSFLRPGWSTETAWPFPFFFPSRLGCRSMLLVPTPQSSQDHALVGNCTSLSRVPKKLLQSSSLGARLGKLLDASDSHMERSVHEYSQSGLPSPYPSVSGDNQSEASSADHASAAQYPSNQEARSANYSASATPTSEYGAYPQSARSTGSFPEHSLRQYHPASNHSGSSGGMAQQQTPTSPSMPLQDGRNHQPQQVKSDSDVPIDPSIAAPSPTYPHGQYSPYATAPQEMPHTYQQGAPPALYAQPRPDWANYGHPGGQMGHHPVSYSHPPTSAPPGRPAQVGFFKTPSIKSTTNTF